MSNDLIGARQSLHCAVQRSASVIMCRLSSVTQVYCDKMQFSLKSSPMLHVSTRPDHTRYLTAGYQSCHVKFCLDWLAVSKGSQTSIFPYLAL